MTDFSINKQKTAILFMDFQNFILENFVPPEIAIRVVDHARNVLEAARKAGCLVIHVNVCFRSGYPEINNRNKMFSWIRDNNIAVPGRDEINIHPELTPIKDEPVVYKRRINAFGSTDLDMILRAQGIETLILAGVATSNVVLSTFNQAFDLDYHLAVISDACADGDEETHQFLMQRFFPKMGHVQSAEHIVNLLEI